MSVQNYDGNDGLIDDAALKVVRHRARVLLLLDAAERAGVAPLSAPRLHAFAYLADVLSPVWDLPSFDGKILKSEGGPHYPDLQDEIDRLIVLGLVEVSNLRYIDRPNDGARVDGSYALRFDSTHLPKILAALGADPHADPLDSRDRRVHAFLVELAGALSTLPDDEIDLAASVDATYSDARVGTSNVVDFASWASDPVADNPSVRATERFMAFLPKGANLSPAERIYLYASYLGRRIHAG